MTDITALTPGTWSVDASHSRIGFVARHLMITKVRGNFGEFDASLTIADDPLQSSVTATVQLASVHTGDTGRDEHLRSADFLDVEQFPTMTFTSTRIERDGDDFRLVGDLTIKGVTKPVTLAVTASAPFNHAGGVRRGIEATASVNRKDFGLRWEYPGEGPGIVVGDIVQLTIDAELVLKPEPSR